MRKILKIGLTGGISSGKSTVAKYFTELKTPIIDTDLIAHELLENNILIRKKIIKYFGTDILINNNIDRKKLRTIVFNDLEKLSKLEKLLHPLIEQQMLNLYQKIQYPYCIFVIPLLFEKQKYYLVDRILVVQTNQQQQIARTIKRDNISNDEVTKIINTQASNEERLKIAHDIINNNNSLEFLHKQVLLLHKKYLALACSL